MMTRYKLTLEYIGTNFSGWQRQVNSYSVQEALEKAAKKLLQKKIDLVVAGRTDSGVHAEGQVAHLDLDKPFCERKIHLGINFHLLNEKYGKDISVKKVTKVSKSFNARFSAKKKLYQYLIYNCSYRSAIYHKTSWWIKKKIDLEKIIESSKYLIGSHDFTSFRAKGCQANSTFRTIENIKISKEKKIIKLNFLAKSFLYNQVRIMVGTLNEIGTSSLSPIEIKKILEKKDRKYAGITAPSRGLTLKKVIY